MSNPKEPLLLLVKNRCFHRHTEEGLSEWKRSIRRVPSPLMLSTTDTFVTTITKCCRRHPLRSFARAVRFISERPSKCPTIMRNICLPSTKETLIYLLSSIH